MDKKLKLADKKLHQVKKTDDLISKFYKLVDEIPQKGYTSSDCQKINILCRLQQLEQTINGLYVNDFIINE